MTTQQTRASVDTFYARVGAGDISGVTELLTDDFHWEIPGDTENVPWLGKRNTAGAVEEFFTHMGSHVDRKAFDIDRVVADGQDAVVLGRAVVTVRSTGKLMDTLFAAHLVVEEDGRISRFFMYEDSWHVASCLQP